MVRRAVLSLVVNALALWLTVQLLDPHVVVVPFARNGLWPLVSYLVLAAIFGTVNALVGTVIRVVGFLLYLLTLGLISFLVNGVLLLLTAWVARALHLGMYIESFWWGVLAAFVLGVFAWLIGLMTRPLLGTRHPVRPKSRG